MMFCFVTAGPFDVDSRASSKQPRARVVSGKRLLQIPEGRTLNPDSLSPYPEPRCPNPQAVNSNLADTGPEI